MLLHRMMSAAVYVRIARDRMRLRKVDSGDDIEVLPAAPFTTTRLLVGEFAVAQAALKEGIVKMYGRRWFRPAPFVLMHPLEMTEGGLSEIEKRILQELAIGAGARKVDVWVGPELSDAEVKARFDIP